MRYRGRYDPCNYKYIKCRRNNSNLMNFIKNISIILGSLLLSYGMFKILQNTVVYSGYGMFSYMGAGSKFALAALPFLLGIALIFLNPKSKVGWISIIIGVLVLTISIFTSLRMRFLPMSLFKALFLFSLIVGGVVLILKGILKK